jgi:hypothetical protein
VESPNPPKNAKKATGGNARASAVSGPKDGAAAASGVMSPLLPQRLGSNKAQQSVFKPSRISSASCAELFAMLAVKVATIQRFANRWQEIQPTGTDIVDSYSAQHFVEAFMADMSSDTVKMDRPTATKVFKAVHDFIIEDDDVHFDKQREWAICFSTSFHQALPQVRV